MDSRSFYLKKEVRNAISEIETILELYSNDELDLILKKIKKNRDDLKLKGDAESVKTYVDRIFELCPECNCIPVAVEFVEKNYYSTEVDLDSIFKEVGEVISFDDEKYIIPHTTDEMTFGDWEKILKIWKILLRFSGLKDEVKRGEISDYRYTNLYVISKDEEKIVKIEGLNKERDCDYDC